VDTLLKRTFLPLPTEETVLLYEKDDMKKMAHFQEVFEFITA
jgi:hypothetical protein